MRAPLGARLVLKVLALLVPGDLRGEWLEEWNAELESLVAFREAGRAEAYPGVAGFVMGAIPHAMWIRTEGWTMESVAQDLRFAARVLRRAPAFTLVAALTLALGIGANASMFTLVNGLLFRAPAGIVQPDRLVQIARSYDGAPRWDNWSWPAADFIRREADVLSGVAGFSNGAFVVGRGEDTEAVPGQYVSGNFFQVLGVTPALGRLFDASDEVAPGAHPVVVLSHGLWMRRFGGSPSVVGTTLPVGSTAYEIVGVAPEGFTGVDALGSPPELFAPAFQRAGPGREGLYESWGSSWFYVFGRLRDGVSFETAEAAMDAVSTRLRAASDVNEDIRVLLAPGVGLSPQERAEGRSVTLLLTALATLVLLLTCANVGNLFLARTTARVGEVSVRQALGAARGRLIRQLVTESVLLSLAATLLAVPLLAGMAGILPSLLPWRLSVSLSPDIRVYAFLAGIGILAGILFGVVPSWLATRKDVAHTLREGSTTGGRRRNRLRDALVIGQLALSLGLVSGAALLGRSLLEARGADPGFDPDGLVVGFLNLRATGRYDGDQSAVIQERLVAALEETPGVASAAIAGQAPILGGHSRAGVAPEDQGDDPNAGFEAEYTPVTPGYFRTLGIRLIQGRTFRAPAEEADPVVMVNEALARRFWPGQDAVGKRLVVGPNRTAQVIGVVADVQMRSLRAPANPGVYYPYHQVPESYLALHVRASGATGAVIPALRRAVASVDAELPVTGITDLREGISLSLAETRTFVKVVTTFAGLALALSLIGLYGLITHGVTQRNRELGIRLALGADAGELMRLVLGRAMTLALVGVTAGLGVALVLGRALQGVLFGVHPTDPLVLASAAAVLAAASVAAAWLPARRAGRVDAVVSLRNG